VHSWPAVLGRLTTHRGMHRLRAPMTIWIGKQSHLVRRVNTETNPPQLRAEFTIEPTINVEIAEKLLELDPPVEKC
jgi:hypothetical protein